MATDGGGKASRLRWLYVARCAVAFLVTVIAVVVLVRAVVVMLRPEKLYLKVTGGYVSVDRIPSMPPRKVNFNFTLIASNPSGRVFIDFTGIHITLTDSNASKIADFDLPRNISLPQQMGQDAIVAVTLKPPEGDVPMRYVQDLFDGRSISAEMEVDGLLTDRMKGVSTNAHHITYFCLPVTIVVGGSSSSSLSSTSGADTTCLDKSEAPAF